MRIFVGMIRCLTPRLLSEFSICQGLTVQLFSLILIKLSTKPLLYFILSYYVIGEKYFPLLSAPQKHVIYYMCGNS